MACRVGLRGVWLMLWTRRDVIKTAALAAGACAWPVPDLLAAPRLSGRQFHASLSVEAIELDPDLPPGRKRSG